MKNVRFFVNIVRRAAVGKRRWRKGWIVERIFPVIVQAVSLQLPELQELVERIAPNGLSEEIAEKLVLSAVDGRCDERTRAVSIACFLLANLRRLQSEDLLTISRISGSDGLVSFQLLAAETLEAYLLSEEALGMLVEIFEAYLDTFNGLWFWRDKVA
ncbi:MAG: hypothetical protein A2172_02135 [Candidatus Woykebacteria bacterium RBG_13_40_15]|uniref:Uncharacterized protein n=1 Tax=Candidatus Woykebacteria bacterium RBG_13_40_15 TaxID=1802593 RepID=A0A1G1W642_9BACT|nr:MAG: hypothetical protein A2172_02135 [Candidatus Woykebacteria bacterium RBG_13_40_15]